MIVTRIIRTKGLNAKKRNALAHVAVLLGEIRAEVWRRYGSITGATRSYFDIRNEWMRSGRRFAVPARLWKETLNDVLADIAAYRQAAKDKIKRAIFVRTVKVSRQKGWNEEQLDAERKRLFTLLKSDKWASDPYLRRMMRKYFHHGRTRVNTHVKLDTGCYTWFERGGHGWLAVMSLERGKRIAIPLASNYPISGTVRLIVRPGATEVEVHYTIEAPVGKPCGNAILGVDKGYTEVFVDSDGEHHGVGLGQLLSAQTDANNLKYQHRNKIRAIAEKSTPVKRNRIYRNNLGRRKLDCRKERHQQNVRTVVYTAVNTVIDKAHLVAAEDLTAVIKERGSKRIKGPQEKRRLSAWVKGIIAEALKNVSYRRSSTVRPVNCAYTSQVHSQCGCLAIRKGDTLYCEVCGVVVPSDREAARVILARLNDREISRWTPYWKVKSILQERTSRYRLGLLNQDSSCAVVASTESELPASDHEQL